ncbi:MAG: DUF1993 domain-containing protein [Pseudorhodobacter sp.]
MYDQSIVPMLRTLSALSNILTKAESHATAKGIKPDVILGLRLFPDMMDFTKQVQLSCDFAVRAAARLTGAELPSYPDFETSFEQLQTRIKAVQTELQAYPATAFEDAATRKITLKIRGNDVTLTGQQFLSLYALPQFYFHVTTAYNLLRHNGVEIGKADYMGA